jgi:uncharacterized protein (DUF488 family)
LKAGILFTIGHSNRELSDFLALLTQYGLELLIDIRTLPGSRKYPHFDKENLSGSLQAAGIDYRHFPELGGRRRAAKDSVNTGWYHPAFRGYADYMQTEPFKQAVIELSHVARHTTTVIMCSESVPWRCHRSLLGDALLIRGFTVTDIISRTSARPHKLTPWARVDGQDITYPASEEQLSVK